MRLALACLTVMVASLAAAQPLPTSDPRLQLVPYDPDKVVTLDVALGYAAVIELSPDEAIDSIVIGNSAVWQITETRGGDKVVVKPMPGAAPTNLILLTDQRRYVFLLESAAEGQSSFAVRFTYPVGELQGAVVSPVATYRLQGDRALFPLAMFDDGKRTTVTWSKQTPLPAVFTMTGGQNAVVNGRMVGNDYVIEGIANRYLFRFGDSEAVAVRRPSRPRR
jgi:type IV secretion system protein VirB9